MGFRGAGSGVRGPGLILMPAGGGQFYPQNLARCAGQPHPPVKNYIFSPELHVFHPPPVLALVKSDNTRTDYTTWNGDGSEKNDLAKRIKVAYRAPAAQAYITPFP